MNQLWGIDLGGTKIECAVISFDKKKVEQNEFTLIHRERIPTESDKGYDHIVNQVATLINRVSDKLGYRPTRIGIGTPGTSEPGSGLMKNCNSTSLNGMPFLSDLEVKLHASIIMVNDANCFAIAESKLGIVQEEPGPVECVFGVIMGTGVGGGIVVHGKALNGIHGIGGEWGHNFLDESGGPCYCGRVGCTETIIAGPSLERFYASIAGEKRKLKEIVSRYRQGSDPFATKTMERLFSMFGKGIAQIINVLDPQIIVIGGGVGNIDEIYTHGVESVLPHLFNPVLKTKFVKPKLGDSAGVFGAALLFAD